MDEVTKRFEKARCKIYDKYFENLKSNYTGKPEDYDDYVAEELKRNPVETYTMTKENYVKMKEWLDSRKK